MPDISNDLDRELAKALRGPSYYSQMMSTIRGILEVSLVVSLLRKKHFLCSITTS